MGCAVARRRRCVTSGDYPSEYAAITAVAGRLAMSPETLRLWIRQDEAVPAGPRVSRWKSRRKSAILASFLEVLPFFRAFCLGRRSGALCSAGASAGD